MIKSEMTGRKRVLMVLTCVTVAFFLLTGKLAYIQIIKASELSAMVAEQRRRGIPISPKRGTIYDRNMNILAMS
ncbi:MAG TPA: stage V sporulation protein D, partial [Clostridia bacterium]|nr:stage V sporulation protein D [Clostridia bacterium]